MRIKIAGYNGLKRSVQFSQVFVVVVQSVGKYQKRRKIPQRLYLDVFVNGRIFGSLESAPSDIEVSRTLNMIQCVGSRLWYRFQNTADVT